jgi:hypothetical protein
MVNVKARKLRCWGFWAFRLRTGWVVVRRKVRCPSSSRSTVIVFSDVDGEHSVGMGSVPGQFLPDDDDDPAVGCPALRRDGLH